MGTQNRLWYQKKRTWFLLFFVICTGLFISTLPKELPRNVAYLAKAYSEPEIAEGALAIAKRNPKIIALLGELEPMHTFDMVEGSVGYSKTGDSVAITIGVRGDKKIKNIRSKMDVLAEKVNGKWEYVNIKVRIKKPDELKQTIPILVK
ncbi:hypothetical protein [Aurantibacter sp.]|uniref:hypothetical protein n=1 Tax=Aurantibacter sp. TaxID=2807103 RepID=UPI00326413AD